MPQVDSHQREVFYAGKVQGVGFRYTVHSLAGQFPVAGFVRNLPDGRVQLVAEGETGQLDRFLAAVRAEMGYYIGEVHETERPAAGRFDGFEIRY